MRCIPSCFGQLRSNLTIKRVQHQCSSPSNEQHESLKVSQDKPESDKVEEEIVCPTKLISKSGDEKEKTKDENTVLDHSNGKAEEKREKGKEDECGNQDSKCRNGKAEEKRENGKEDECGKQDFLIQDRENSSQVEEESLFSLSIDSRKHFKGAEMGEKEVSSPYKMNNTSSSNRDPMVEESSDKSKPVRTEAEMAAETSLSSWLVEPEKSPEKMNEVTSSPESKNNYGDRQILGEIDSPIVIKELK